MPQSTSCTCCHFLKWSLFFPQTDPACQPGPVVSSFGLYVPILDPLHGLVLQILATYSISSSGVYSWPSSSTLPTLGVPGLANTHSSVSLLSKYFCPMFFMGYAFSGELTQVFPLLSTYTYLPFVLGCSTVPPMSLHHKLGSS